MKVNAVENTQKRHSCLYPMAQGAAIGAVAGVGVKYLQPVTDAEKSSPEYLREMSRIEKEKKVYNLETQAFLDRINKNSKKTLAEDVFVKMYDGLKEGDEVGAERILKAFRTVQQQKPEELSALKRLFSESKNEAELVARKYVGLYNHLTKMIRPTKYFIAAGAVVGAFIALIKDVLRTDVKPQA